MATRTRQASVMTAMPRTFSLHDLSAGGKRYLFFPPRQKTGYFGPLRFPSDVGDSVSPHTGRTIKTIEQPSCGTERYGTIRKFAGGTSVSIAFVPGSRMNTPNWGQV